MKKLFGLIVAGFLFLNLSGCLYVAAGAAGAAGWVFYDGWLTGKVNKPLNKVHPLTLNVLRNMKMTIQEEAIGVDESKISAKTADGQNVWVILNFDTPNTTKIKVRVGYIGDERSSRNIIEAIERNLNNS